MSTELILAGFIIAVGLCVAGAGAHLYQAVSGQPAMLRYDGRTYLGTLGHLAMSFFCGPYIMLQMGLRPPQGETVSLGMALVAALVAFGWAFLTGLMLLGIYVAIRS
jgi:hypothetical protein